MNENIPLAPAPETYRLTITAGEHSARHIRRIVRRRLDEWQVAALTDAVELAVTELVANVVRHVPDRRCSVLVLRRATGVRVEVTDGSERLPAMPREQDLEAEGGRGLLLVEAVVDRWGVRREPGGGKTVWFECAL